MADAVRVYTRSWHLPWLWGSFALSLVGIWLFHPFAGPQTGDVLLIEFGATVISHVVALLIGVGLTPQMWWKKERIGWRTAVVVTIAMAPVLLLVAARGYDAWYTKYRAPYDRFAESLISPIPASVSNLEFISYENGDIDWYCTMLQFTISPEDLDTIIRSKHFVQIDSHHFRRPDDLFTHPEYLPVPEPVTFYIVPSNGKCDGYTLKVSGDRKHVIFRHEDGDFYRDRTWDDLGEKNTEHAFLSRLSPTTAN